VTSAVAFQDLLDAMPDSTAVLDETGTIVAVNHAWQMFTHDNGGEPSTTGPGVNYLSVCSASAAAGSADAAEVEIALRQVIDGETVESVLDYPCPSPVVGRWFTLRATPIAGQRGVLVSHTNITRRKVAELDLERRASQDPLTGLANRERFSQQLEAVQSESSGLAGVAVVYLDLNGFKPVNDTFGHAAGDEILQAVSGRLREVVRPQDTVARLGGDEFAVVVPGMTAPALARFASRLKDVLLVPHLVHGQSVTVGASIGAYLARADDSPAQAVERADAAMYAAKRSGPAR
jgi:diguanylate cyclase (GGDEF)-like protein